MLIPNIRRVWKRDAAERPTNVTFLPEPMTHDPAQIAVGKQRAEQAYRSARTPVERGQAIKALNHWRQLDVRARILRAIETDDRTELSKWHHHGFDRAATLTPLPGKDSA